MLLLVGSVFKIHPLVARQCFVRCAEINKFLLALPFACFGAVIFLNLSLLLFTLLLQRCNIALLLLPLFEIFFRADQGIRAMILHQAMELLIPWLIIYRNMLYLNYLFYEIF